MKKLNFFYFQDIFCKFLCNIFLTKFLLKLPTNVINMNFTRVGFQSLTKKSSIVAEKNSTQFDLINEEESTIQFWYVSSISS